MVQIDLGKRVMTAKPSYEYYFNWVQADRKGLLD